MVGRGEGVVCVSMPGFDRSREAAEWRNKWRQDGGGRRHKALDPGGFALLEIKLQALLGWSVGAQYAL
jgi:hypothetical protein